MVRISSRLIAAATLTVALAGGSALGQFTPPRPPGDLQQAPLPPPSQQPLPPPAQPDIIAPEKKTTKKRQQQPDDPAQPGEKKKSTKTKTKGKELPPPATTPETINQTPEGERIANPTAVFSGLDKISGRIITFDVALNETVQFGALQVTPRACYTRPATETQNTTAFVEVEEITLKAEIRRIFTGWMFASSPGLNAVEHPIYDVWLIDCKMTPPSIMPSEGQQ
ncbi:MAG: DUF2155 domain-containing protein [Xanthobacteraceae bacterium]|nr:DUF2155 domain-containing protein [Xanthobacteraceae bacterium]QYK46059.1 MAG: DUF2155 domain-containing protein [Xanthobacteraceae bacterium]